ncbi:hypothetical protein EMQ25_06785 [Arsenicitalea aurantiaca]|uniref:SSD domain-containing protein n=1 Tax=Arsenicitalea aurantiaca TaxID=1783274 RepID=A0A433XFK9_9HYPH|nr:efflux RND transporter permease subunit [Arsenicitalea aurantiaca]RUT32840.1 hypothetical protein EMQ25_06785 [Arsenicitalea aurantiaca]
MSIGFGLERLGLLTLRYPRIVAALVIAFTALCVAQTPRVSVDGDLMRVFNASGEHFERYEDLTATFGTFEDDAYVLVTTDRLTDPDVIEELRFLAFELELNDYAVGTLSPFSLRKPAGDDQTVPAVPENMSSPEEVRQVLTELRQTDPIMQNLIVEDLSGMVMIMFPNNELTSAPGGTQAMIASLRELVALYDSDDVRVELTGPPIWTSEMLDASMADQTKFSIFGFLIGAVIALLTLRNIWAALIATVAPGLAVLWVIGTVMLLFGSFTFLTIIVTTLVLVLSFADSMYFTFSWIRLWNEGMDPREALRQAIIRVLPAAALTSLTTMVSFATLTVVQGQGIEEFGLSGMVSVGMAYVCVATFSPLIMLLAIRLGFVPPRKLSVAVTAPIPPARMLVNSGAKALAIGGLIAAVAMLYPHFQLQPRFSFEDFLPRDSAALQTAESIDSGVGGVAPVYVRVPLEGNDPNLTDADFERVRQVHEILEASVGEGKVISGASLFTYSDAGFSREQIFDAVGPFLRQRFVTDDGSQALVTGFLPTIIDSNELRRIVNDTDAALAEAGIAAETSGYRLMTTFASTDIIEALRNSLMGAIVLNIFLISLAFRSWKIGLVSLVPNVLPILGTELYLYFSGTGLQITTVIALTIAFGIALDDTIHYLSTYVRHRRNGESNKEAVDAALVRVGPAIVATTMILCAGVSVVAFSALPQVAIFGTLVVITLLWAVFADLLILPSLLIAGGRFFDSLGEQK